MTHDFYATFARGSAPKASAKGGQSIGQVVAQVVTGQGSGMNGTVNGKRGFQPGNTYGKGRAKGSAVATASNAHRSARHAVGKHIKAGTITSNAGRAALKDATTKYKALHEAKAAAKAEKATPASKGEAIHPKPLGKTLGSDELKAHVARIIDKAPSNDDIVKIADIRKRVAAELGDVPRHEVDKALKDLHFEGHHSLQMASDGRSLTADEESAAIPSIGTYQFHQVQRRNTP